MCLCLHKSGMILLGPGNRGGCLPLFNMWLIRVSLGKLLDLSVPQPFLFQKIFKLKRNKRLFWGWNTWIYTWLQHTVMNILRQPGDDSVTHTPSLQVWVCEFNPWCHLPLPSWILAALTKVCDLWCQKLFAAAFAVRCPGALQLKSLSSKPVLLLVNPYTVPILRVPPQAEHY